MRARFAALLVPLLLTGCGTSDTPGPPAGGDSSQENDGAGKDVSVKDCRRGDRGLVTATLDVKNSTGETQSYLVMVDAKGPDGSRVAELIGSTDPIPPGKSVKVDATGAASRDGTPDKLKCTVVTATRF